MDHACIRNAGSSYLERIGKSSSEPRSSLWNAVCCGDVMVSKKLLMSAIASVACCVSTVHCGSGEPTGFDAPARRTTEPTGPDGPDETAAADAGASARSTADARASTATDARADTSVKTPWPGMEVSDAVIMFQEKTVTTPRLDAGAYVVRVSSTGDVDLYVHVNGAATTRQYTCKSTTGPILETCRVSLANEGELSVLVRGVSTDSVYTLTIKPE